MNAPIDRSPVSDTVPKVNNELAVGEDVEFQRKWWKFERAVWVVFTFIVLLDVAGVFGRGPVAKTSRTTTDGSMKVSYERIERTGTPSVITVRFNDGAIRDHQIQLWASESLVTELGNKQIAPQPQASVLGDNGISYTFPATNNPATAVFSLQPSAPGFYHLTLRNSDSSQLRLAILVMP